MKVIFLGSGPFGVPTLERLASRAGSTRLVRVVTRPDRPAGRGRKLAPTPIRARAAELGLECDAPESVNDPSSIERLGALEPDLLVAVDYGEMLRHPIRAVPRIGSFNLHASLLPRHRGAAPVAHAILAGDAKTGVTLFRIEKSLDSGPIIDAEEVAIDPAETAGELEARLAAVAAGLLERNLEALSRGGFQEIPQEESRASQAPKLTKAAGLIDWDVDPRRLTDFVRALNPWPVAYSFLQAPGERAERTAFLRVRPAAAGGGPARPPGTVEEVRSAGFRVSCRGGPVEVLLVRREGRTPLDAAAYLRGRRLRPGDRFGPLEL